REAGAEDRQAGHGVAVGRAAEPAEPDERRAERREHPERGPDAARGDEERHRERGGEEGRAAAEPRRPRAVEHDRRDGADEEEPAAVRLHREREAGDHPGEEGVPALRPLVREERHHGDAGEARVPGGIGHVEGRAASRRDGEEERDRDEERHRRERRAEEATRERPDERRAERVGRDERETDRVEAAEREEVTLDQEEDRAVARLEVDVGDLPRRAPERLHEERPLVGEVEDAVAMEDRGPGRDRGARADRAHEASQGRHRSPSASSGGRRPASASRMPRSFQATSAARPRGRCQTTSSGSVAARKAASLRRSAGRAAKYFRTRRPAPAASVPRPPCVTTARGQYTTRRPAARARAHQSTSSWYAKNASSKRPTVRSASARSQSAQPATQSASRSAANGGPSGAPAPWSATRLCRNVTSPHASQRREGSSRARTFGPTTATRGSASRTARAAAVAPGCTRTSSFRRRTTSASRASAARMPRFAPPA